MLAEVTLSTGIPDVTFHDVPDADTAADVTEIYRDMFAEVGLAETVTRIDSPIQRGLQECYPESAIGNAVVDAYRWVADADVAICNAMMLRAGPPLSGEVTVGDLQSLIPFDNEIHTAKLTGRELMELFSNLRATAVGIDQLEVFGHVSGACLQWQRTVDGLKLVTAIIDGESPDPQTIYTVAAPTFAFMNDLFAPLRPDCREANHGHQHDALIEFARKKGIPPQRDGRMTLTIDRDPGRLHSLR